MEMNVSVLLIIFFVILFIFFIWTTRIKRIIKKLKKEKERLVESYYPDLTTADKKYRKTSINNYYNSYFKDRNKLYLAIPYLSLISLILSIIWVFHIDTWGTWGIFLCLSILMILVSFYIWLSPSLEKQQVFWEDYLKKYPDNPLKVVLFPLEKSKQVAKIDFLFSFMGNIYTLYGYCNVL